MVIKDFFRQIILSTNSDITFTGHQNLLDKFQIINFVLDNFSNTNISQSHRINTTTLSIRDEKCCGKVSKNLFEVNVKKFTESINFNSCLNGKISIDKEGNIRNCPSMKPSFGNIRNTSLENAASNSGLRYYWNISKDIVEVCRDCEFRYICTDCRAYLQDPENEYSKPLKCGYNPKTGKWANWRKNPLSKKAIIRYDLS